MTTRSNNKPTLVASVDLDALLLSGVPVEEGAEVEKVDPMDIGRSLIAWRGHTASANVALSNMAWFILQNWDAKLVALIGEGDKARSVVFTIGTMFEVKKDALGNVIHGFLKAAYVAVADWAGVPGGFDRDDTQAYKRSWRIAAADAVLQMPVIWDDEVVQFPAGLVFAISEVKDVAEKDEATGKPITVKREVPTEMGRKAVERFKSASKALGTALTDEQALEKVKAMPVALGVNNDMLEAKAPPVSTFAGTLAKAIVDAGYDKPDSRTGTTQNGDKAEGKFGEALAFVTKCLTGCLSESGETDYAPSKDMVVKLGALYELIGSFIAEDTKSDDLIDKMGK